MTEAAESIKTFSMVSTSRQQDLAYLALADVAAVSVDLRLDYRIVGGNAVSLLVAAFDVRDVPDRETADADVAAEFDMLAKPELLVRLAALGYSQDDGSRLSRPLTGAERGAYVGDGTASVAPEIDALRPMIDFMAPSLSGHHQPNQPAGDLTVDAFPGISLGLAQPSVRVSFDVRLTTGMEFTVAVPLPSPLSALCIKLLAYRGRASRKDAVDIWRLLAVCRAAGVAPGDWKPSGSQADALKVLATFTRPGNPALKALSADTRTQATVRALAAAIAPSST